MSQAMSDAALHADNHMVLANDTSHSETGTLNKCVIVKENP